jgi:hypothetical protein
MRVNNILKKNILVYNLKKHNEGKVRRRMEYKDKIIAAVAENACEQVAAKVIKTLRAEKKGLQSDEDSGLTNIWDEICVQMQRQQSETWEMYLDIITGFIESEVGKLDSNIVSSIWLQTDNGKDWDEENQSNEEANIIGHVDPNEFYFIQIEPREKFLDNSIPDSVEYNTEDIANYILDNYILSKAADFTNKRIQKYLDGDYDSF